ncbi:acetyltransferase [Candidatus Termititenax aidoneus]|uniref:Acetyltransferase n=1 Tax=Termititenax aidoneus TaxID=2218524 RepID=A0A388TA75_TERA1|nr:acetyltransferase [Candidatus Termititenax aidoneus]
MKNYKVYKNVKLGKNCQIGDFVIIGLPPAGKKNGELRTSIGDNAIIRSHTVIYAGNVIGVDFQAGHHVLIREENKIGEKVSIGTNTVVEHHIRIGNGVRTQSSCFIPEYSTLEDGVWLGPNVVLTNARYPRSKNVKKNLSGPVLKQNAKLGANVTVLPGVNIGENVLIGAAALVTKDIPAGAVAYGAPAAVKKKLKNLKEY